MTAVAERHQRRFERLFDAHHRAVLRYALRRTTDPHDAADVVAETFLVAWRRLDDVPAGAAAPWLFGVARHVVANQRRGDRRRTELAARLGETLRAELAAPDHAATFPEAPTGAIAAALASLSSEDREILTLSAWEELTPTKIAEALGLRGSTARSRLRRARSRFETALQRHGWQAPLGAPADLAPERRERALSISEDLTR